MRQQTRLCVQAQQIGGIEPSDRYRSVPNAEGKQRVCGRDWYKRSCLAARMLETNCLYWIVRQQNEDGSRDFG